MLLQAFPKEVVIVLDGGTRSMVRGGEIPVGGRVAWMAWTMIQFGVTWIPVYGAIPFLVVSAWKPHDIETPLLGFTWDVAP